MRGGFFPQERGKERNHPGRVRLGGTSPSPGTAASLVTLPQYTRAPLDSQWPKEKISILQMLFVCSNTASNAHMNTIYRKGSAKERTKKGAWFGSAKERTKKGAWFASYTTGQATHGDLVICSRTRQRGKRRETLHSLKRTHGVRRTHSGVVLVS